MNAETPAVAPVLRPREAARLQAIGTDEEFGRILAVRPRARWHLLLLLVVPGALFLLAAGMTVDYLIHPPRHSLVTTPGQTPPWFPATVVTLIAAAMATPVVIWFRHRGFEYRFFEHGFERWSARRGSLQRLSYLDVESLTYTMQPQHAEIGISWMAASIVLETPKGSKTKGVRMSFNHRAKPRGFLSIRFEGTDPLDLARDAVAAVVAERLAAQVTESGSAPWTSPVSFTQKGLSFRGLLGGATIFEYDAIERLELGKSWLEIHFKGPKRQIAIVSRSGKNFYPGLALLRSLVPRSSGGSTVEPARFVPSGRSAGAAPARTGVSR